MSVGSVGSEADLWVLAFWAWWAWVERDDEALAEVLEALNKVTGKDMEDLVYRLALSETPEDWLTYLGVGGPLALKLIRRVLGATKGRAAIWSGVTPRGQWVLVLLYEGEGRVLALYEVGEPRERLGRWVR